jgi:hypothetical protein
MQSSAVTHARQTVNVLTLMRLAPSAKRSVFQVSSLWLDAGVTLQMMAILAPDPVKEGCSSSSGGSGKNKLRTSKLLTWLS